MRALRLPPKFQGLHGALSHLLEEYNLVSFVAMDVRDEDSLDLVLAHMDNALQVRPCFCVVCVCMYLCICVYVLCCWSCVNVCVQVYIYVVGLCVIDVIESL